MPPVLNEFRTYGSSLFGSHIKGPSGEVSLLVVSSLATVNLSSTESNTKSASKKDGSRRHMSCGICAREVGPGPVLSKESAEMGPAGERSIEHASVQHTKWFTGLGPHHRETCYDI